jgi:hypothetical protein
MTRWQRFWHDLGGCDWQRDPPPFERGDSIEVKLLKILGPRTYRCSNPLCGKTKGSS